MELFENEQELISASAETLYFNTFHKSNVRLTITNQRVIIGRLITSDEYLLDDIVSVERFKAVFMNIGLKFHMKNGKTVSLATRHIKKFVEQLHNLGKM